jgi:hypothetical protein
MLDFFPQITGEQQEDAGTDAGQSPCSVADDGELILNEKSYSEHFLLM